MAGWNARPRSWTSRGSVGTPVREAQRLQSQLAADSLKPLSRFILQSHSCSGVLGGSPIEAVHHRADVAEIGVKPELGHFSVVGSCRFRDRVAEVVG
jgi:hypothetical protein